MVRNDRGVFSFIFGHVYMAIDCALCMGERLLLNFNVFEYAAYCFAIRRPSGGYFIRRHTAPGCDKIVFASLLGFDKYASVLELHRLTLIA